MGFTALMGLIAVEFEAAVSFAVMAIVLCLFACVLIFTTRHTPAQETNSDALIFLCLFWLIIPIIASAPYLIRNVTGDGVVAYFETVSALTTTGASTLSPDNLSITMHIWRSLLQWFGGVITATFAVVVLAALNLKGTGVHRSMLFTLKRGELFSQLMGIGRVIAGVYALISFIAFVAMAVSGTPVFDALCLAMSSVSTGGLAPRSDVLSNYVHHMGLFALMISCLLGGMNIALIWDVLRSRSLGPLRAMIRNVEHRAMGVIIGVIFIIGFAYMGVTHMDTIFVETIFFASSTGFDYDVMGLEMVPPIILIALALIGGSALSTAGGVKLIRIVLLFNHLKTDLNRLSHPSRTVPIVFRGQSLDDSAFLSIWMYFFGYTFVLGLGILALCVLELSFEQSVAMTSAFLSNMGPLLQYTLPLEGYEVLSSNQLLVGAAIMLIGRVEVLAVLSVFSPSMWRR